MKNGPDPAHPFDKPLWGLRTAAALIAAGIFVAAGLAWLAQSPQATVLDMPPAEAAPALTPGTVARMDSPALTYSPGWSVSATGADPAEPADPWAEPAGTLVFSYTGRRLALQIAPGDYWGYLYITVDDGPANRLPVIRGNVDSRGQPAGYKPLYAPERADSGAATPLWLEVHTAEDDGPHQVYLELWRSWGQSPLTALAVDALPPPPRPRWPGALLLVLGLGLFAVEVPAFWRAGRRRLNRLDTGPVVVYLSSFTAGVSPHGPLSTGLALFGVLTAVVGVGLDSWLMTVAGIGLLALTALVRPAFWMAALAAALPFYYHFTAPLLPGLRVSLIDLGVYGGFVLVTAASLLRTVLGPPIQEQRNRAPVFSLSGPGLVAITFVLAGWALVATATARYMDPALDEWRLVFLAGAVFGLSLLLVLADSSDMVADRRLILGGWLAGAVAVAAVGVWQFAAGQMLIQAEGVTRIRGFYGSPNNLALYLERALPVLLALALFTGGGRVRVPSLVGALLVGTALLLTFSKGALFLAVPVIFAVLWLGGFRLLRAQGRSVRPLWILAALGLAGALLLLPFLGTARFANLLDLSQGTGYLRIQLWRSAWQMAVDYPAFGVAPDNFLYWYRSDYLLPTAWQEPNLNHPHNWLLDWWTRLGLVGLALGLLFWGSGLILVWRSFRDGGPGERALALGLLAAALGALAHGLIDLSYALPDLMLVWVLIFTLAGWRLER